MPDIEQKCRVTGQDFVVDEWDQALLDKLSPIVGGKKFAIPAPTLSPSARLQRRIVWRAELHLWNRSCDKCDKSIHSSYAPERPETVYCEDCYLAAVY